MRELKVCFVGVGSIAKRHISNLIEVCNLRNISLHIDAYRRESIEVDGVDNIFTNIDSVPNNYDVIFITNPTEFHLATLQQFHDKGKHFFIEKPVVALDQISEARKQVLRKDSVYYVACPLRYNAVIQWLKSNINIGDVISVRSISSSYLPDWRPGQDYRDTYSAHKSLGGGVSIDLIHEWDYLTYLFGWPQKIHSLIGKKSNLEIDSDDYAIYIAEFENMIAELHLDYFGKETIREIMLITTEDTIVGDIVRNKIKFLKSGKIVDFHEERNDYQKRELDHFLDLIDDNADETNEYENAINVLELTQNNGRWDK